MKQHVPNLENISKAYLLIKDWFPTIVQNMKEIFKLNNLTLVEVFLQLL